MKKLLLTLALIAGGIGLASAQRLSGEIMDAANAEKLVGVSVFLTETGQGTITDADGRFELNRVEFPATLRFSYVGYESKTLRITRADSFLSIRLKEATATLGEVVVKEKSLVMKSNNGLSALSIQGQGWSNLPAFAGERDVVGVFMLMPGIKKAGDASGGMLVRGGGTDQNLVLMNGVPLYHGGHLISFYTPFQPELIREATLYKGNAPASMGGRLSSVLDVKSVGPSDSLSASATLGLVLGKAFLSTPLVKNKVYFSGGFRRSLPDLLWPLAGQSFPARFYDGQANFFFRLSEKHQVSLHGFSSSDKLGADGKTIGKLKETEQGLLPELLMESHLQEQHLSVAWTFTLHKNTVLHTRSYVSGFQSSNGMKWPENTLLIRNRIRDYGVHSELTHRWNLRHESRLGGQWIHHHLTVLDITSSGGISGAIPAREGQKRQFGEGALFADHEFRYSGKWTWKAGLRMGGITAGPFRLAIEPSIQMKYQATPEQQWFIGVHRSVQQMHRVSNASTALPIDSWVPSSAGLLPQSSWQYSAGWRFSRGKWQLESEIYYKNFRNLTEFKEGALPLKADRVENEMVQGRGKAYGWESMVRYEGKKTGIWVAYTLSWSDRTFDALNGGRTYYARFDRRHDLNITLRHDLGKNWSLSAVFNAASGARFTPRIAQFLTPGVQDPGLDLLPVYGARNSYRLSAVHRLDLNIAYKKQMEKGTLEFQAGAYNVYNQIQPFRLEILEKGGKLVFREIGMFGFVPSFSVQYSF